MVVTVEEISDEFDIFGETVDDDELQRFQDMCQSWNIDANRIVNEWMAFSASKKRNLNTETLDMFNREWLQKKLQQDSTQIKMKMKGTPKDKKIMMLNKDTINSALTEGAIDILGAYVTPEEKSKITQAAAKRQLTPEDCNSAKRLQLGANRSPMVTGAYSPMVASPAGSTPSAKYTSRSNAGEVLCQFGDTSKAKWSGEGHGCSVSHYDDGSDVQQLSAKVKYMFQKVSEKASVLDSAIHEMSAVLQNAHGIEEFSHLALPCQEEVTVCGRVCCDSIGRLNKESVILEGSRGTSAGKCIRLDLSDLKQFSLFPGQIVACDGVNVTGKKFAVSKIYKSVPLPFPPPDAQSENVASRLSMAIACGPFAPSNSLDYSPLADLIKYVNRDKPDLLLLMGPFVDVKNTLISTGDVDESFSDIFANQMIEIGRATQRLNCKVVIVSSHRDAHHCSSVYPQPPYSVGQYTSDGTKRLTSDLAALQHLTFTSDPSTLKVNGVVVGVTSTDALMHLTKSEVSVGAVVGGADRMTRLVQHVIHQRCYYPLYPPLEELNVDYELWEARAQLPVTPHVLVLPSDLKSFIKDVDGVCCVNPGRLTMGQAGGTYARMVVDVPEILSSRSPSSACAAQIVKV